MKKREANFQVVFGNYITEKGLFGNFELKRTKTNSIPFDDSKKRMERQINSLLSAESKGFFWKYSDQDQREKLFDCSHVPPLEGYVVLKFPKFFCIIRAMTFKNEKIMSNKKSITSERAKELSLQTVYN